MDAIYSLLHHHPSLTIFGFRSLGTPDYVMAGERRALEEDISTIRALGLLLEGVTREKKIVDPYLTSYKLKRAVEEHWGHVNHGSFIAAMLLMNFKWARVGANIIVNIGGVGVRQLFVSRPALLVDRTDDLSVRENLLDRMRGFHNGH